MILTLCLLCGGAVGTASAETTSAETATKTGMPLFDEDNVVLSFGAISDIHILGDVNHAATKKYETALQLLKKHAGGKLDAVTIAGDISNNVYDSSIGEAFCTVTDGVLGKDANVFFVTGNHDAQNEQWDALHQVYADLSRYTGKDLPSSQHDRGNRHMVIGGYHYIGVNMMDYWNSSEAMFADEDLQWLKRELAAAEDDAPDRPIFVYTHAAVYGTTYGSDLYTGTYWGSKKIYSILAQFPQVVTFSGHLHFPVHDSRTIYQKDFTSLNCGSVQYMSVEHGLLQSGNKTEVADSHSVSTGLLVQVDKDNTLKITRLDFANDRVIGDTLYVFNGDLTAYNPEHIATYNKAPRFGEHAGVSAVIEGENLKVTFDAATDNDLVHHYQMDIKSLPSGTVKTVHAFSEFYFYAKPWQMPKAYVMNVPYTLPSKDTTFEITLTAVDCYGMTSIPVSYTYTPNDTPPTIGGVTHGETYYTTQKVTATDTNLDKILIDGKAVTGAALLAGNVDDTYTVVAVDKGGNRSVAVVTMKPVSALAEELSSVTVQNVTFMDNLVIDRILRRIDKLATDANLSADDKKALNTLKGEMNALTARIDAASEALNTAAIEAVRDITAADVTAADRANLQTALADYNKALATYSGNYTQDAKDAIAEEIARVSDALTALGVEVPTTTTTIPTGETTSSSETTTTAVDPTSTESAASTTKATTTSTTQKQPTSTDKGGDTPKPFPWLVVGILAALVIGGGVVLFFYLRKRTPHA